MDARTEIQRDLRTVLDNLDRHLRQASAATVNISQGPGQPPYSQINFLTVDGSTVTYTQTNNTLTMQVGNDHTILTKNLQYIAFSYPETDINTVLSISVTLQKKTYSGRTTALQMAISSVRIMNP
jgi:hypothetical protein